MKPCIGDCPQLQQLSSRELSRIDNRINPRSVTSWTMAGASYRRGIRYPGYIHLHLSGGGYIYYREGTALDEAFADARDRGYDTAKVERHTKVWVDTGKWPHETTDRVTHE